MLGASVVADVYRLAEFGYRSKLFVYVDVDSIVGNAVIYSKHICTYIVLSEILLSRLI